MKKSPLLLCLCALLWVSCATSNPQSRIKKNPEKYSSLSPQYQSMVEQGQIGKGMPKDGVLLAMGKPESVSYGAGNKGEYEQWTYYSLTPIMTHNVWGGWGYGGGYRCGRYGGLGGFGYGPTITYVPRKHATVKFTRGVVDEYQSSGDSLY